MCVSCLRAFYLLRLNPALCSLAKDMSVSVWREPSEVLRHVKGKTKQGQIEPNPPLTSLFPESKTRQELSSHKPLSQLPLNISQLPLNIDNWTFLLFVARVTSIGCCEQHKPRLHSSQHIYFFLCWELQTFARWLRLNLALLHLAFDM